MVVTPRHGHGVCGGGVGVNLQPMVGASRRGAEDVMGAHGIRGSKILSIEIASGFKLVICTDKIKKKERRK